MIQTSRDIKNQSKIKTETLKNGQEKEWVLDSDGYTDDLLSRSRDKPPVFGITIKNKGKIVAGPFRAELPNLNNLPLEKEGQPPSAVYLIFHAEVIIAAR